MCSVVGIIARGHSVLPLHAQETVNHLLHHTAHRGPDEQNSVRLSDQAILGANRLAIVDRHSPAASMPILSPHRDVALVLNGEIYNHNDLRTQLRSTYTFRSGSDAEVALAAYLHYGAGFVEHLHGMFAIIIFDARSGEALVCTDRMGEKPLYMLRNEGFVAFCSELAALVSAPDLSCTLEPNRVAEIALFRFSLSWRTPYAEVDRLKPGEVVTIARDGTLSTKRYWQPPLPTQELHPPTTRDISAIVEQVCYETLASEEPIGVLLSGGLDSTIITHYASRLGKKVHTFSIGFRPEATRAPDLGVPLDEFQYSREVAAHYGTEHHEIVLDSDEYWDYFERWTHLQSDPLGVEEAPCLLRLCREASEFCRIIACGSGPDEVLEGYGHSQWMSASPPFSPPQLLNEYLRKCSWFGGCDIDRLCRSASVFEEVRQQLEEFVGPYLSQSRSLIDAVQYINSMTRLNAYELRQMDLASMAWGIEARSPLCDTRFIDAALRCSPDQKASHGIRKRVLIEAFSGILPQSVVARRKEGFPIPLHLAYTARFESMVSTLLDGSSLIESLNIFDFDYLRQLWRKESPTARLIFFRILATESSLRRR